MGFIDIKNLVFQYKRYIDENKKIEETAIDQLNLTVKKGDFVGILGANGSGKSTLAKQISALLFPTAGTVFVDGKDTKDEKNVLSVRKTAGIVFQNPDNQIVGNIVEEEVAFGPENLGIPSAGMERRVEAALEATGMQAYQYCAVGKLSGGQKQRVAISGILAMEPQCMILDEPTSMIDPVGRAEVQKAIRYLNKEKGITIIYITHHVEEVAQADYLYVMKKGKIQVEGRTEDVLRQDVLESAGLALPFPVQLRKELEKIGISIPENLRTEEQMIAYFMSRKGGEA